MPNPPKYTPPAYWMHNFDLGLFRLIERYENGEGLFEPIDDDMPDSRTHPMTPEARRRRYWMGSMTPHF